MSTYDDAQLAIVNKVMGPLDYYGVEDIDSMGKRHAIVKKKFKLVGAPATTNGGAGASAAGTGSGVGGSGTSSVAPPR